MVTFLLLVVGGLNWLLEVFGFGIGRWLPSAVAQGIYVLVGLSAIYEIAIHKVNCRTCNSQTSSMRM